MPYGPSKTFGRVYKRYHSRSWWKKGVKKVNHLLRTKKHYKKLSKKQLFWRGFYLVNKYILTYYFRKRGGLKGISKKVKHRIYKLTGKSPKWWARRQYTDKVIRLQAKFNRRFRNKVNKAIDRLQSKYFWKKTSKKLFKRRIF